MTFLRLPITFIRNTEDKVQNHINYNYLIEKDFFLPHNDTNFHIGGIQKLTNPGAQK